MLDDVLMYVLKVGLLNVDQIYSSLHIGRKQWSSGYGMRLMFCRSRVWFPPKYIEVTISHEMLKNKKEAGMTNFLKIPPNYIRYDRVSSNVYKSNDESRKYKRYSFS